MADMLAVFPASRLLREAEARDWFEGMRHAAVEEGWREARCPSVDALRGILRDLGWTFSEHRSEDSWYAYAEPVEGVWPPFSELTVLHADAPDPERTYSFRLGPLDGPLQVVRSVAVDHGPQVTVTGSYGYPAVVSADSDLHAVTWQLQNVP